MYQGTTPEHTITVPFSTSLLSDFIVTYIQNKKIILTKRKEECTVLENEIHIELTQEETLSFSYLFDMDIELKVQTTEKKVLVHVFKNVPVQELINKEVFPV